MSVVSAYEKGGLKRALCLVLVSLAAVAAVFVWINIKLRPFVTSVTEGYAKILVSYTLNSVVKEELEKRDYEFTDVRTNGDGSVMAVNLNAVETNLLRSALAVTLRERTAAMEEKVVMVPLGNFLPYHYFSGLGPKVPIRFLILSNTSIEFTDDFRAAGINQTLYTVTLDIKTRVRIYIPTMQSTVETENNIPIAQTLIVGDVPDSYTNVEGTTSSAPDIVLDAVN